MDPGFQVNSATEGPQGYPLLSLTGLLVLGGLSPSLPKTTRPLNTNTVHLILTRGSANELADPVTSATRVDK